jgi:hypothetical protein
MAVDYLMDARGQSIEDVGSIGFLHRSHSHFSRPTRTLLPQASSFSTAVPFQHSSIRD